MNLIRILFILTLYFSLSLAQNIQGMLLTRGDNNNNSKTNVYTFNVDITTDTISNFHLIKKLNKKFRSLVYKDGKYITAGMDGTIYSLNPTTGNYSIDNTYGKIDKHGIMALDFDQNNNMIYEIWNYNPNKMKKLYKYNKASNSSSVIKNFSKELDYAIAYWSEAKYTSSFSGGGIKNIINGNINNVNSSSEEYCVYGGEKVTDNKAYFINSQSANLAIYASVNTNWKKFYDYGHGANGNTGGLKGEAIAIATSNSNNSEKYDFGDAPDKYTHVSHKISQDLYLGESAPDGEDDQQSSEHATGDGVDDNDAVVGTLPELTLGDNSYTVPVKVFNNTGKVAKITAWIDFNRDGIFQYDEALNTSHLEIPSSNTPQTVNITWDNTTDEDTTAIENATVGKAIMRIRLTTSRILRCDDPHYKNNGNYRDNYLVSPDGEVEDYEITIEENSSGSSSATCYALTDDSDRLYKVSMQPGANPLPEASYISINQEFNGEGSAYRASNNKFYAFNGLSDDEGPSDLFSIDVASGEIILVKHNLINGTQGSVEGAEFYFNPTTKKETLYVISQEEDSKLYAFDPENWSLLPGYPKNTNTDLSSLAIDPISGAAYAIDDYNYDDEKPKVYQLDLATGATTQIATLENIADAEGLAFASDGNLYIEDDGNEDELNGKKLYMVNLQTGELTPAAITNSNGDIEGLSCNGTQIALDNPTIKLDNNNSITEGNSGTRDLAFSISLDKPASKDILVQYEITDINTTANEDYILDSNLTILIPKDADSGSIVVKVNGDTEVEDNESFSLKLVDATNAIVDNKVVVGMIINDDEAATEPFICTDTFYISNKKNLETNTDDGKMWLHSINRDNTPYDFNSIGDGYTSVGGGGYNAIGYNVKDNFIYGIDGKNLIQIDKNGAEFDLGEIDGFNYGQMFAGEFDRNGFYYVAGWNTSKMYKIDIDQKKVVKTINLHYKNSAPSDLLFSDIAIDKSGKYFYTMLSKYRTDTSDSSNGSFQNDKVVKIRISDGEMTVIGGDKSQLKSSVSLVYSDVNGNVFMMNNESGYFKLNTTTGELTLISSTSYLAGYNDGTSCANANIAEPIKAIAEYRFDACSWHGVLGEVKDSSENKNHLNAINGVQTINNGVVLRALDINGSNQRIQGDTNLTFSNELTLNAWIKTTTNQAIGGKYTRVVELSKDGTAAYSTDLAYLPNGKIIRGWTTNEGNTRSTEVRYNLEDNGFHDGEWHLLSYTYNKGVAKLYVDGELKQTRTKNIGNIADPKKISIGGYYNRSAHRFTGAIDEVTIFDKALSIEEINVLKNHSNLNRQPLDCSTVHDITGTVFQDENRNNVFDAFADVSLKNVKVELFRDTNSDGQYDNLDTLLINKNSDINGNFAFTNLTSGYYLLKVDENDTDIPQKYTLSTSRFISIHLVNGSSEHNYFAFTKDAFLPIGCLENALMFQNRPTDISYLNLANGSMYIKAEDITPGNINAAGFNKKDGYYWGFNYTIKNGTLSRIGKDANENLAVDHFSIPNLNINSYTGDIDNYGHLYLKEAGKGKNVAIIDLDPSSDTYLTKLRNVTLDQNLSIADWAFNPQDDKLYAVGANNELYKIEPSNGDFISITDINLTGSTGYGASFFDKDGNYYIYRNNSGEIFRIDVDAEHPQAILFSQGGVVSYNDGAMCTDVDIRFDFGDLPFATTLAQDGARHRIKTSEGETHYLGEDVDTENDGEASTTADRDDYDDGVTVNGSTLQNFMITSKSSLSNIHVVTHGNGYLNAWIDWNRDGDFNTSEQIANGVNGSSGTIDLELTDIPDILFNGEPIYARFRYSSQQELNATGVAPDGEVEDYAIGTANYPTLIVSNVNQTEGDSGTKNFTFHLSLSSVSNYEGSFSFATEDGTATTADNDYIPNSDTINFGIGSRDLGDIIVQVKGDTDVESDEDFYLNFSSPSYLNILGQGIGTIINDDSPRFHIERARQDSTIATNQAEQDAKESFYTQIAGRDFDYSIVSYDKNSSSFDEFNVEDMTMKVEVIDKNSTVNNDVIYSFYTYIGENGSRFDILDQDSHKLELNATRDAQFKVSYLLDENGTLVHGLYTNEQEYNEKKSANNQENYGYSDHFAIRPASYRIELNDIDENNNSVTYAKNNVPTQNLSLIAEYPYTFKAYAVHDENKSIARNYKTLNPKELNVTLDFDERGTANCADTNTTNVDKNNNYNFINGQLGEVFSHNNVGKYTLHIEDINWTDIDKEVNNPGCIVGSSSNTPDNTGKFGCNIASNEGNNFFDINMTFQAYEFSLKDTKIENPFSKNYIYMNNLDEAPQMGIDINTNIYAQGFNHNVLTNFTNGCAAENVKVQLNTDFNDDNNRSRYGIVSYNRIHTQVDAKKLSNMLNIPSDKFLPTNDGNSSIQIRYNIGKDYTQATNPVDVKFQSFDANTSYFEDSKPTVSKINAIKDLNSTSMINKNQIFYYTRVSSYLKYYPETDKISIDTPLFVEVYCRTNDINQSWCRDTMKLTANGMNRNGKKTYKGWYLATNHTAPAEGRITSLSSDNNTKIDTNYVESSFSVIGGKIDNIKTFYKPGGKLKENVEAEIGINTSTWLRHDPNSSYFIKLKPVGGMTGISPNQNGDVGYNLMRDNNGSLNGMVEHNGKMSW